MKIIGGNWLLVGKTILGKRIMTEVVKLITKFGFKKIGLKRMCAYAFHYNKASQRVLIKGGYRFEGILKKHAKKNGKFLNDYYSLK